MKKLLLITLFSLAGLVALDATARNRDCGSCHVKKPCAPCHKPLVHREVIDLREKTPPCCVKYVEVQEPAVCFETVTKECRWECPKTCTTDENRQSQFHNALVEGYEAQSARVAPLERTMMEE